jgi:hypothetical protein
MLFPEARMTEGAKGEDGDVGVRTIGGARSFRSSARVYSDRQVEGLPDWGCRLTRRARGDCEMSSASLTSSKSKKVNCRHWGADSCTGRGVNRDTGNCICDLQRRAAMVRRWMKP